MKETQSLRQQDLETIREAVISACGQYDERWFDGFPDCQHGHIPCPSKCVLRSPLLSDILFAIKVVGEETTKARWNLTKPSIEDQSDEVVRFCAQLLGKNNEYEKQRPKIIQDLQK